MSACATCLRRAWLLGTLSGGLEYRGRSPARLAELLARSDEELIQAAGGTDSRLILEEHARFDTAADTPPKGVERICRHDPRFPPSLVGDADGPAVLHAVGGLARLSRLLQEPSVAIVGTRAASDYGIEVAHGLARDLAAAGATVVGELADGIGAAALTGAAVRADRTVTVMAGGVDVSHPARRAALHRRLGATGCVVAELPCGQRPRSWCHTARARVVAGLADLVVVVEARERGVETHHAQFALSSGRALAAVPGRVSSPLSRGAHALLRDGALLVRNAEDVLAALRTARPPWRPERPPPRRHGSSPYTQAHMVEPAARVVLDRVACGHDTLSKLLSSGCSEDQALRALAALELAGELVRGDAGRYLPRG